MQGCTELLGDRQAAGPTDDDERILVRCSAVVTVLQPATAFLDVCARHARRPWCALHLPSIYTAVLRDYFVYEVGFYCSNAGKLFETLGTKAPQSELSSSRIVRPFPRIPGCVWNERQ